jgi:hypothetical protein
MDIEIAQVKFELAKHTRGETQLTLLFFSVPALSSSTVAGAAAHLAVVIKSSPVCAIQVNQHASVLEQASITCS